MGIYLALVDDVMGHIDQNEPIESACCSCSWSALQSDHNNAWQECMSCKHVWWTVASKDQVQEYVKMCMSIESWCD